MDCRQAQQLFDAYLDGELSPSLATELGAHRVQCASCRRALALLEVSGHIIRADHEEAAPDDAFADRLLACMDEPNPALTHRMWRIATLGGGLAAAALVALAFLGMFDSRNRGVVLGERANGATRPAGATMSSTTLPVATFDELLEEQPSAPSNSAGALQELANQNRPNSNQSKDSPNVLGKVLELTAEHGLGVLGRATEKASPLPSVIPSKPAVPQANESEDSPLEDPDSTDSAADE